MCVDSCADGTESCDGACVDTQTDPQHCGACGDACDADQLCELGSCVDACSDATTECSGGCVDTETDVDHCGGCGNECAPSETCEEGICVVGCAPPNELCDGLCVDTDTDVNHCGGCGIACDVDEVCVLGSCDGPPRVLGLLHTAGEDRSIGHDLFALRDDMFDLLPVNPTSFDGETVAAYKLLSDGRIIYVAAQDTEGQRELYLQPAELVSPVKLNPALPVGVDIEPDIVVSGDESTLLYRADADVVGTVDLYAVDLGAPGAATKLSGPMVAGGDVFRGASITTDGSRAAYLADQDTDGLLEAYLVDLASPGNTSKINAAISAQMWDVKLSGDGAYAAYRVGNFGVALHVVDTQNPGVIIETPIDGGESTAFGYAFTSDGASLLYAGDGADNGLWTASTSDLSNPTLLSTPSERVAGDFRLTSDDSQVVFRQETTSYQLYVADLTAPFAMSNLSGAIPGQDVIDFDLGADDDTVALRTPSVCI